MVFKWILQSFKDDFDAMTSLQELTIIDDKKNKKFAFKIKQKPNKYVPTDVQYYEDDDVLIYEASNEPTDVITNYFASKKQRGDKKCLENQKKVHHLHLKDF